jgi:hypothetical protein
MSAACSKARTGLPTVQLGNPATAKPRNFETMGLSGYPPGGAFCVAWRCRQFARTLSSEVVTKLSAHDRPAQRAVGRDTAMW